MQTGSELEKIKPILDALISTLEMVPHTEASLVEVESFSRRQDIDAAVDAVIANEDVVLLIEVKNTVYPRDVREMLWRLVHAKNEYFESRNRKVVPMVAAQAISLGARELLRNENVGFFDIGGSLFVPAKGAYLYIDRPVPKSGEKSVRSLFTGKRSQVLHALLVKRDDWFGVTQLSEMAEVSPGTASETLTALDRLEWVIARGHGPSKERRLSDASALLDEWKRHIRASTGSTRRRYFVSGGNSDALAHRLAAECEGTGVEYVLTQDKAAQEYAPYLSAISRVACRIAPGKAADAVLAQLDARIVSEGSNLDVIETHSRGEFLFKERRSELWLASPFQVYLDLYRSEGRSRDMAEHLRKELLGI
jgi:hypothetical protein